jgi:hypothetical protein
VGAANGFTLVSPDTRYGDGTAVLPSGYTFAQQFQCPGSGSINIKEIGVWGTGTAAVDINLAIFDDDGGGGHPSTIVANSDSGNLVPNGTIIKSSFSYVTLPSLTGGVLYWLAVIVGNATFSIDRKTTGGTGLYISGLTYPTWPANAAAWHTHTDSALDTSMYAVYEAPASGAGIPVLGNRFNNTVFGGMVLR